MKEENRQLIIILLIVFIGFMGSSIAYPIFPPLFLHESQSAIIPASWNDDTRRIVLGIALAAYPLGQFIGSPVFGGCSDRYGRKTMLMISLFGSAFGYLLSALSLDYNWLWILIISRFFTGFMESNFGIVRAMAADLETISKYKSFGRINGVASISYIMGPLIGGFFTDHNIVSWFSYALPFLLAAFLSIITFLLAARKLVEKKPQMPYSTVTIWQRFNIIGRMRLLVGSSGVLKNLLIISSIFTVAVDIFYEFGPVYLTGLWSMTPAGIAVYNAALSLTLAIGSGLLPHHLSLRYPLKQVIAWSIFITAIILALMVAIESQIVAFILFGLIGLSIATVTTNLTIQLSNAADKTIQGEVMGTQLSIRMLGDTIICLVGGFVIISSFVMPIVISSLIALITVVMYIMRT